MVSQMLPNRMSSALKTNPMTKIMPIANHGSVICKSDHSEVVMRVAPERPALLVAKAENR